MLQELSKMHEVTIYTRGDFGVMKIHDLDWIFTNNVYSDVLEGYDVILSWGSLDRPWNELLRGVSTLKILQFAGGPTEHEFLAYFDAVAVESKVYEDRFKEQGCDVFRSFGTNQDVFYPIPDQPKTIQAIYPASFCGHKNIETFARAMEGRGILVGNWNEERLVGKAKSLGTPCLKRVSSETLNTLYNMSKTTVVPCGPHGGAQRVVLESMACGIPVVVASDNDKCVEFVQESGFGMVCNPIAEDIRDCVNELIEKNLDYKIGVEYISSNWSGYLWAKELNNQIQRLWYNRSGAKNR